MDVVRYYPTNLLPAMTTRIPENGIFYVLAVFVLTYIVQDLGLD